MCADCLHVKRLRKLRSRWSDWDFADPGLCLDHVRIEHLVWPNAEGEEGATPRMVSFDEADAAFGKALSSSFYGRAKSVLLVEGDCTIETDLHRFLARPEHKGVGLLAVKGDLVVKGRIALYDSYPGLYVGGDTIADTLEGGDVYGYYNDGILETAAGRGSSAARSRTGRA